MPPPENRESVDGQSDTAYDTTVAGPRVVLDTNVLVAALRSRDGASFRLVSAIGRPDFEIAISVALVLEYEDALLRHVVASDLTRQDVGDLLDYLCKVAHRQEVFFLWRPTLADPGDDLVLEVAVAAGCGIVTFNHRDFAGAERFGIELYTPAHFLEILGGGP